MMSTIMKNPTIRTDTISLLNGKNNWEILKSIYSMIDSTAQYDFALERECKKKDLSFTDLQRMAYPFRHFLSLLMLKRITVQELKEDLKSLDHTNSDKLSVFMNDVYDTHKERLNRLLEIQITLNHSDKSILNDVDITTCTTKIKINNQEENIPFVLFDIDDKTYRCSKKDIEFIIEKLNDAIAEE
ncbi:MAG: hypothetical protein K8823_1279 [Cenarchaeum symbiont of Oopsacas minuta]|nr:hypothetical protein [Cenarchaeum symbiont of Oopsacas minuta]